MPEPTSTATLTAATLAVPTITAMGVPLGLRPDVLVAGFSGSIVALSLLNAVPGSGDTWPELLRTTLRRMSFVIASSLTAGYLAPMALLLIQLQDPWLYGISFGIGARAQRMLTAAVDRLAGKVEGKAGEGAR